VGQTLWGSFPLTVHGSFFLAVVAAGRIHYLSVTVSVEQPSQSINTIIPVYILLLLLTI